MRTGSSGYRRNHLRALVPRVEVDAKEVRIMGSKSVLLHTLVAASSAKTAGFGVPILCQSGAPGRIRTHDKNGCGEFCNLQISKRPRWTEWTRKTTTRTQLVHGTGRLLLARSA